jgi:excisionase family DNA binding protein
MILLTVRETARKLRIGYASTLRLIHDGHIPAIKFPDRRSLFVDEADVETFMEASKAGAETGAIDPEEQGKVVSNGQHRKQQKAYPRNWYERLAGK